MSICLASLTAVASSGAGAAARAEQQAAAGLAGRATAPRTVVSLTFDDGDADQMAAARVLHQYGMSGTFYIITGAVGAPNYLSLSDLHTLAAQGDEIGGHTVSHLELPHVSTAEARRQVCDGRNTLIGWGFQVRSFAYPGGAYSLAAEEIVRACGFDSARTVTGLRSPGCPGCTVVETIPPRNPYAISAPGQVDGTWTLATLENVVTTAERRGGGWLPFIFHHICGTARCSSFTVRASLLTAFAKWLAPRRDLGTVVKTVGQVTGGPVRPMVGASAARPHGVINPSLATIGSTGAVDLNIDRAREPASFPHCWVEAQYGQNTETWQRVRGGHASLWAMRLTMTSHTSGDAKLIPQFDLGQCSIPVTAGQSYDLATWYRSSALTQFAVYYRTPQGDFLYWTSSPFYPAASHWTEATWTTPPLPAGAGGLSFGLALSRKGWLITDEYRIRATPRSVTRGILDVTILVLLGLGGGLAGARALRRRRRHPQPDRRKGGLSEPPSSSR